MSGILDHFSLHDLAQLRCSGACGSAELVAMYWSMLLKRPVTRSQVWEVLDFFAKERGDVYTATLTFEKFDGIRRLVEGDSGEPTSRE